MKKIILLTLLLLICSACGFEKDIIRTGDGREVLEYTSYAVMGEENNRNIYFIKLYDDKTISKGVNNTIKQKIELDDKEYQKIINYVFSDSFTYLDEDLTDSSVMDGSMRYITLYFEDGSSKKYGGANPSNRKFKKAYNMLEKVFEGKEEE